MTKGLPRSMRSVPPQRQNISKQTISLNAKPITVADGAPGFGTVVIGGLPEANILFLGAVLYARFTSVDADLIAAFTGNVSIGSAPTVDNTLTGSDVDIIPSTALGAATGKVSPLVRATHAVAVTGTVLDNTDGSLELNMNLLIDDASISGPADLTVTGALIVSYIVLGDD